jgi:hypothetical protein
MATGALTIWTNPDNENERLLLAGRQDTHAASVDTGYTYGYLELELDAAGSSGIKDKSEFEEPGIRDVSSVDKGDNERYKSTIGKHPVKFLFQAPESVDPPEKDNLGSILYPGMTLFASTQQNGVWSYRERDGMKQWNAEN